MTVATDAVVPGVLTQSQLRRVPGFSTATAAVTAHSPSGGRDPRGPCGGVVPALSLEDAAGVAFTATTIRGGTAVLVRLPPGAAKTYLDARMADARKGCASYASGAQRVQLVRIVRLHREFQQALAVVSALTVDKSVRAVTEIEVRRGDTLAITVIYTDRPMADTTVRGLASLMGTNLVALDQ